MGYVDEGELIDTGFLIDERATPPRFVFPDGSSVPAPSDLGQRGYFFRKHQFRELLRVMIRVKRILYVQPQPA